MMQFKSLVLRNWRQFRSVNMTFHPRLTVITGANGAGKSTILNILSQHLGFSRPYLATPVPNKSGGYSYDAGFFVPSDELEDEPLLPLQAQPGYPPLGMPGTMTMPAQADVGRLTYGNGVTAGLMVPRDTTAYGLTIHPQQQVNGIHISSHRIMALYQPVQGVAMQAMQLDQAYHLFNNELLARYNGQHTGVSPVYRMKETLIGMAAFGEGNSRLQRNEALLGAYSEFEDILKVVLPDELGFTHIIVRIPDIVLQTRTGEFVLDSASGGVNALIELCWQIFLYANIPMAGNGFVVTIDEPENHLHPSMQRTLLPKLLTAFPDAQFIVATHSPFVVSSVEESYVYALRYRAMKSFNARNERQNTRRIVSQKLDQSQKAGTTTEVLAEVLGVEVTLPQWALNRVETLIEDYRSQKVSTSTLNKLRSDLAAVGFEEYYPQAVARLVSDQQ